MLYLPEYIDHGEKSKMGSPFFMDGRGRFKRVRVGSYSHYVGSHSLCVEFYSRYGYCCRRRVGYHSLYMGYAVTIWAIAASV